jgi:hypothetical protein
MTLLESVHTAHDARDTIQGLRNELERMRNLVYRAHLADATLRGGTVVCPENFEFETEADGFGDIKLTGFSAPRDLQTTHQRLAAKARELVG